MMYGYGWGALWMFAFWAVLVTVVVLAVRSTAPMGTPRNTKKPVDLLRERYARGEVDRDEYHACLADLSKS